MVTRVPPLVISMAVTVLDVPDLASTSGASRTARSGSRGTFSSAAAAPLPEQPVAVTSTTPTAPAVPTATAETPALRRPRRRTAICADPHAAKPSLKLVLLTRVTAGPSRAGTVVTCES
ncbi:hypothetical protein GCM10027091_30980 [Streptomyces daliensis]